MTIRGLDEYTAMLNSLGAAAPEIAKQAVYAGAGVVADEVRKKIEGLQTDQYRYLRNGEKFKGLPKSQKKDLLDALGIAGIDVDSNGNTNTKIGFSGYGSTPTKKYPSGVPNALVARSVESGSTVRQKTPFVRPAVTAAKERAQKEMGKVVEREIKKIYTR